ncbi:CHAT domain-containing protein [uncultured Aquimarina sp.]|uniref:CHAT domain-containing protein n=1 Tax=uncultured Aquimarina sp. TaxID=575652 RepID=UPI0026345F0B|nr:CHAT domain-containing protein [uncultured Aquimarina sp.]
MLGKNKYYFIFLIVYNLSHGQNNISWQQILNSEYSYEQKKNKLDSIIKNYQKEENDSILERITHKYAIWLYKNKKIKQAIQTAHYSQELKNKKLPIDTSVVQHGLNNIAFLYYKDNNYQKSIYHYQKSISLNSKSNYASKAYSELGRCYKETGDFYKAKIYFELAHSLLKKNNDLKKIITNSINSNEVYIKLGGQNNYDRGIKNMLLADSLSNVIKSKTSTKYNIKIALGNLYNQNETINTEKASYYYKQGLDIAKNIGDSSKIADVYNNIGSLYNNGNPDVGIEYHKKALQHMDNPIRYAISYSNIGYCLSMKEKYNEAIEYYHKALKLFIGYPISEIKNGSFAEKSSQILYKSELLVVIKDVANIYLKQFKTTKEKSLLHKSLTTFLLADELIDLIRIESQEFQSKLYWREHSSALYGQAIEACFLAKDIDNAFYFMEKNKALILTEDITNNRLKQSISIPESIVNREIKLKKSIYLLNKVKNNDPNKKELDIITIKILDLKRNLKTLQDSIKDVFSDYSKFNVQSSPIASLKSIQKKLDDQTVLIEYNISNHIDFKPIGYDNSYTPIYEGSDYGKKEYSKGYLIYITNNESHFIQLPNIDELKTTADLFIKKAAIPFGTEKDIISYSKIGYKVFTYLFPDKNIKEIISGKKLIIIPDNYLNYIPFEALVTANKLDKTPKYLIEGSEISYGYSNFFLKNSPNTTSPEGEVSFLGFAPGNFDKYNLTPIENNKNEVNNINSLFFGEALINDNATKENFLAKLENQNIIHLATHADALDSISPWIAFSDHKLDLEELYLTKNQADLVVLSGCNTLLGKQETGEGVMSLARGFFHSGAKSVVSSLWNVDDRSTSYIMNEFYKNLKNQQSKSQALREAKLQYLKNSSLSESSPHFWATFVLLGDTSPIPSQSNVSLYWLLILPFALFILIIIYRNKKRNS